MRIAEKNKKYWQLDLLVLPAIIYVLIFSYGPMYGIVIAFENYKSKKGYFGIERRGFGREKKPYVRF